MNFVNQKLVFDKDDYRRWTKEEINEFTKFYHDNSIYDEWSEDMKDKFSLFHTYFLLAYDGFSDPIKYKEISVDGNYFLNVVTGFRDLTEKIIANLITNYLCEDRSFQDKFAINFIDYPESYGKYIMDVLEGEEELVDLIKTLSMAWESGKEFGSLLEKITGVKNIYHHISHNNLSIKYDFVFSEGETYSIDDFNLITNFLLSIRIVMVELSSILRCTNNVGDYMDLIYIPANKVNIYTIISASYSLIPIEENNISNKEFMRMTMELSYKINLILDIFYKIYGIDEIISFHLEELDDEINKISPKGFNFNMIPKES